MVAGLLAGFEIDSASSDRQVQARGECGVGAASLSVLSGVGRGRKRSSANKALQLTAAVLVS